MVSVKVVIRWYKSSRKRFFLTSFKRSRLVAAISRKSTGSNGVAVVIVDNDAFRWTQGDNRITTWKKPNEKWHTSFCRVCGSSLPGINDEIHMYVPAGLITEGGESLKVTHHIWVESKAVWDEIGDSGKQHLQSFEG